MCMYMCMYILVYACMYVCIHIYIYTHTYIHTYIHTYCLLCRATSQTLSDAWCAALEDGSGRTEGSGPDKVETRERSNEK